MTLYELSDADAVIAFSEIALTAVRAKCECEYDVGYVCRRCKRLDKKMPADCEYDWLTQYESELAARYGRRLMADAKQKESVA